LSFLGLNGDTIGDYILNKLMLIILLIGISLISCVSKPDNLEGNSIMIDAEELMNEFSSDEANALQKYEGKPITIVGVIFEKATPKDYTLEKDRNYIIFGDYSNTGIGIQCYFDEFIYNSVNVGEKITVEGNFREITYAGNVFKHIVLGESKIIK
jgi:hypothetical protein